MPPNRVLLFPHVPKAQQQSQDAGQKSSGQEISRCTETNSPAMLCLRFGRQPCTDAAALYKRMSDLELERTRMTLCQMAAARYSVVSYSDPLGAMEFFFDDTRGLVAARHRADTNRYCDGTSLTAWFGTPLPECSKIPEFRVPSE